MMNISLKLVIIQDPKELAADSLPSQVLSFKNISKKINDLELFTTLINQFNQKGDTLINEIFEPLLPDKQIIIPVVVTQGIPEPYDAWFALYEGKKAFFFNFDLWSKDALNQSGIAVIKHEATHVLLDYLLKEPNESDYIKTLEYLTIHEGIAHFVGFPWDRSKLLTDFIDKWEPAEKKYKEAIREIKSKNTSKERIEQIIVESNSGKFWDKFVSISGLFRVATIYQEQGIDGIIECIKNSEVPAVKSF